MNTIHHSWLRGKIPPRRPGRPVVAWIICPECDRRLPQSRFGRACKRHRLCDDCRAAIRARRVARNREIMRLREMGLGYQRIANLLDAEVMTVYYTVKRLQVERSRAKVN